jgi:hypothetical protein
MGDIVATVASPDMILNCYFNWGIGENPNEEKEQILTVTGS